MVAYQNSYFYFILKGIKFEFKLSPKTGAILLSDPNVLIEL